MVTHAPRQKLNLLRVALSGSFAEAAFFLLAGGLFAAIYNLLAGLDGE